MAVLSVVAIEVVEASLKYICKTDSECVSEMVSLHNHRVAPTEVGDGLVVSQGQHYLLILASN
jgi:hypothetical protein